MRAFLLWRKLLFPRTRVCETNALYVKNVLYLPLKYIFHVRNTWKDKNEHAAALMIVHGVSLLRFQSLSMSI